MSVLTNVAKVIILGVGNVLAGISKPLIDACYVTVKDNNDLGEFIRRFELLLWIGGWVDGWSGYRSIFFSELLAPVWENRVLKVCVWISQLFTDHKTEIISPSAFI